MPPKFNNIKPDIKFVSHGLQAPEAKPVVMPPLKDVEPTFKMDVENDSVTVVSEENGDKPAWMKKMQGVKRISNKERRRRQNQSLRRLLTPKSALMVLYEIIPGENFEFKVTEVPPGQYYKSTGQSYSAELTVNGKTYSSVAETKSQARHAVAEQVVRDLIISKMARMQDKPTTVDNSGNEKMEVQQPTEEEQQPTEEEPMPMMQLASFALHKLFSEWEGSGVRVPQFKPPSAAAQGPLEPEAPAVPKPKKVKTLPENASSMHPCMLLTYMRPQQEYRELARLGDKPPDLLYKMGVIVDGATFVGQGGNKKEARRQAAIAACKELFGVEFNSM